MKPLGMFFALLLAASPLLGADETNEPPQFYTLSINGQKQIVTNDRPLTVSGTFTNPEVRVVASPLRTFAYADLRFDYPAQFLWEADLEDPDAKLWLMTGSSFALQVHLQTEPATAREFATDMCLNMDFPKSSLRATTHKLGGQTFRGYQFAEEAAPDEDGTVVEVLDVSTPPKTRFLILVDIQEGRKTSAEGKAALRALEQTFRISVPPKN